MEGDKIGGNNGEWLLDVESPQTCVGISTMTVQPNKGEFPHENHVESEYYEIGDTREEKNDASYIVEPEGECHEADDRREENKANNNVRPGDEYYEIGDTKEDDHEANNVVKPGDEYYEIGDTKEEKNDASYIVEPEGECHEADDTREENKVNNNVKPGDEYYEIGDTEEENKVNTVVKPGDEYYEIGEVREDLAPLREEGGTLYPTGAPTSGTKNDSSNRLQRDNKEKPLKVKLWKKDALVRPPSTSPTKRQSTLLPNIQKRRKPTHDVWNLSSTLRQNQGQSQQQRRTCSTSPGREKEKPTPTPLRGESSPRENEPTDVFIQYLNDVYIKPFERARRRQVQRPVSTRNTRDTRSFQEAAQCRELMMDEARLFYESVSCPVQCKEMPLCSTVKSDSSGKNKWVPFSRGVSHLRSMSSRPAHFLMNETTERALASTAPQSQGCPLMPPVSTRHDEFQRCVHDLLDLCGNRSRLPSLGYSYNCVLASKLGHRPVRLPGVEKPNSRRSLPSRQQTGVLERGVDETNVRDDYPVFPTEEEVLEPKKEEGEEEWPQGETEPRVGSDDPACYEELDAAPQEQNENDDDRERDMDSHGPKEEEQGVLA